MNRISIILFGSTPRAVEFNQGDTLGDIVSRLSSDAFPLARVQTWFHNGSPVGNPNTFVLEDGMEVGGTPKIDGGRA
jgi:hypothetical protein